MTWKLLNRWRRKATPPHEPLATTAVRLTDADPQNRPTSITIEQPDGYTAFRPPLPVEVANGDSERAELIEQITRAIANGSLDEFCADARDAHIDARRTGWDIAVRAGGPERLRVEIILLAQELENARRVRAEVERCRAACGDAERRVQSWRQILLGHSDVLPAHDPSAEQTTGRQSGATVEDDSLVRLVDQSAIRSLLGDLPDIAQWTTRPTPRTAHDQEPNDRQQHVMFDVRFSNNGVAKEKAQ